MKKNMEKNNEKKMMMVQWRNKEGLKWSPQGAEPDGEVAAMLFSIKGTPCIIYNLYNMHNMYNFKYLTINVARCKMYKLCNFQCFQIKLAHISYYAKCVHCSRHIC